MPEFDSSAMPQLVSVQDTDRIPYSVSNAGIEAFKKGNNILFMRPAKVKKAEVKGNSIDITASTEGYLNRIVQTHETRMNQFIKDEKTSGEMFIRLDFWSDSIFRVSFAERPFSLEQPEFPPEKARMLVGNPLDDIGISFNEAHDKITAETGKIRVEINKEQFRIRAFSAEGKIFWVL